MTIVVRRRRIIVRRQAPPDGLGWIHRPGFPPNPEKKTHHCLMIRGEAHVFMWLPAEEMWSSGMQRFSPDVASQHEYRAPCSVVTWPWTQPKSRIFRR